MSTIFEGFCPTFSNAWSLQHEQVWTVDWTPEPEKQYWQRCNSTKATARMGAQDCKFGAWSQWEEPSMSEGCDSKEHLCLFLAFRAIQSLNLRAIKH